MAETAVRFGPATQCPFAADVRREVGAYFEARGGNDKGDWRSWTRIVFALALVWVPYGLLLGGVIPLGWAALLACVVIGVGVAAVGFNVAHDSLHGSLSEKTWVNRVVGFMFDVMGASSWYWRLTHNRIHHTFTNLHGLDEDITVTPVVRMSPGTPLRPWHRFQTWFALPAYSLATINWIFAKDFGYLLRSRLGPYDPVAKPRGLWLGVLVGKLAHLAWAVAIPWLVLEPTLLQFLAGFLAMHLTAGVILGVVFQLAHVVEETEFPQPDASGKIDEPWMAHQMRTTADFARGNRLLGWYIGGLNYQVEHHLFPQVNSIHYPAISPIVEACAKRHGLPFHDNPTFFRAVRSHWRTLSRLGRPTPA
jgi:linoleoyl-CoA desaturase